MDRRTNTLSVATLISKSERKAATKAAISRIKGWSLQHRDDFPRRGVFSAKRFDGKTVELYNYLLSELFDFIKSNPRPGFEHILEFEKFQSLQKGPVGPFSNEDFFSAFANTYSNLRDDKGELEKEFEPFMEETIKFYGENGLKSTTSSINFSEAWASLPNDTVRGWPYNSIGKTVDSDIVSSVGGPDFDSAMAYAKKSSTLVCFPGLRLQGKPQGQGAKIRIVSIPSIYYQWINVGLYKTTFSALAHFNTFIGWLEPKARDEKMRQILNTARSSGYSLIGLDFSKFDTTVGLWKRIYANRLLRYLIPDLGDEYFHWYENQCKNQFLLLSTKPNSVVLFDVSKLLPSGVINTQQDGSIINVAVQRFIAHKLGYTFDYNLALALGDDVGLQVPDSLIAELGYQGVLEKISNIVESLGMHTHTIKAYPSQNLVFLQKLYVDENVFGVGSWARSLASFFWPEKYSKKVVGVKDMRALHILAQISIITNAYSKSDTNYNDFGERFSQWWVEQDLFLSNLIFKIQEQRGNGVLLFRVLVDLVGGVLNLLQHLDLTSYDHTGLSGKLSSSSPIENFPILQQLMNCKAQSHEKFDIDVSIDNYLDEDIIAE